MRMREMESSGVFSTAFYELTWPVNWEQCLTFGTQLAHRAFASAHRSGSCPIRVEVGARPGDPPTDVTAQAQAAQFDLNAADFAKEEQGFLVVSGHADAYDADMRITVWTGTDQCLLQLRGEHNIEQSGDQNYYDRFMDSMEIWMHVQTVKRSRP